MAASDPLTERQLLERLSIATQAAGIFVWEFDWRARRISWDENRLPSAPANRHYGQELGSALFEWVHPEDLGIGQSAMQAALDEGRADASFRYRLRLADGSIRHIQALARTSTDADGEPLSSLGVSWDVTDEVEASERLRATTEQLHDAQRRLERAIRGTQDGLWEWDLAEQRLWVSPRYEAILGYAEGEVSRSAHTPNDLVHPDDLETCRAAQRTHFEQGTPYDVEVRMRARGGVYRWMRMRGEAECDAAGRPLHLAGSVQDVTQARAARDALVQASEAAQAASRSKSAFLANVSHEIRTPMNGIIGMTSLLLDTSLSEAQREFAETIRTSASSLLAVLNDILDFSKIEAGKLDVEAIELNLPETLAEVRVILAYQAAAKNLRLTLNVRPDVPRIVIGDPQRIRQCLVNLISNAIKFTPVGEVTVEVSIAGRQDGRVLARFEVRDTGIGLAPEALLSLFQPFVQADSSTTRHYGGTGLGLSIVRRLVEMMGGEVGVHSELGKGSTFWFLLPLRTVDAVRTGSELRGMHSPGSEATPLNPDSGRFARRYSGKVLLVEDNLVNQKVARSFLERLGCEVVLAADGLAAVEAFSQSTFALVLIDLQMPVMDGYGATHSMRKLEQGAARTPIVALTASALAGQRERCLEADMDDLLTKPLDILRLQAVLERFGLAAIRQNHPGDVDAGSLNDEAVGRLIAATDPGAPIELARLRELAGEDAEFARDLARTFALNSAELIAQLRDGAARGDRAGLTRAAHSLKGAGANIHAHALVELCAELEQHAATLADSELTQSIARLVAERERVMSALQSVAAASGSGASTRALR